MCMRFVPLRQDEAEAVLDARERGGQGVLFGSDFNPIYDAYPGSEVPIYVWDSRLQKLVVQRLDWGFDHDGRRNGVFNTRLETALEQIRKGRRGIWFNAITRGRCLVPVRAFYEGHDTEGVTSPRTGKLVKRPYRFTMPGARAFLLAGVAGEGRFSIVTTAPNADVAPVHDRMPLVLGRGESKTWLGEGFAALGDRSGLRLAVAAEL